MVIQSSSYECTQLSIGSGAAIGYNCYCRTVSVAIDGMLKRHVTKDTFEMLLRNELVLSGNKRKKNNKPGKSHTQKSRIHKSGIHKPDSRNEGVEK
jgi:hypothetical protein